MRSLELHACSVILALTSDPRFRGRGASAPIQTICQRDSRLLSLGVEHVAQVRSLFVARCRFGGLVGLLEHQISSASRFAAKDYSYVIGAGDALVFWLAQS